MSHKQGNRREGIPTQGVQFEIPRKYRVTYENVCEYFKVYDLRRASISNGIAGKTEKLRGKLDVQQPPRYD